MAPINPSQSGTSEAAEQLLLDVFADEDYDESPEGDDCDDDGDSNDDHSSSTGGRDSSGVGSSSDSAAKDQQEKLELENLMKRETKNVLLWRETVTGVLIIIGFIASLATFIFLGQSEHESFESTFDEAALIISNKFLADTEGLVTDTKALGDLVTANAIGSNSSWPFVTLPFFELYGEHTRSSPTSDLVFSAPLVSEEERLAWEDYCSKNQGWLSNSLTIALADDAEAMSNSTWTTSAADITTADTITPYIHVGLNGGARPVPYGQGPYAPIWQVSPPPIGNGLVNLDLFSYPSIVNILSHMMENSFEEDIEPVISGVLNMEELSKGAGNEFIETTSLDSNLFSLMLVPVADRLLDLDRNERRPVGLIAVSFVWEAVFRGILPRDTHGIQVVVKNSCDEEQPLVYLLNGPNVTYVGTGEEAIDNFYQELEAVAVSSSFLSAQSGGCSYSLHIRPTRELRVQETSHEKTYFSLAAAGLFVLIGCAFYLYDRSVQLRNEKMLKTAVKSNRIVSSLFPSAVKKRLMDEDGGIGNLGVNGAPGSDGKPLADFFPVATVLFADLAGFTAWSSVREPSQVFILLESIYQAFDQIAKRRRIFKIETIGDCYVATSGLPEPRADHAAAMARFASEIQTKMAELTTSLEETLGPDTGDLKMRVGIHSGPVTAGVLRGERGRYQIFGDTVNTAARMESTGTPGRIQVSNETAKLLSKAGKEKWLTQRDQDVLAKGLGALRTFWLSVKSSETSSQGSGSRTSGRSQNGSLLPSQGHSIDPAQVNGLSAKYTRLVNWNVEMLARLLRQTVARRSATKRTRLPSFGMDEAKVDHELRQEKMVIHEVQEVITLPKFDAAAAVASDSTTDKLEEEVVEQLRDYVVAIAGKYKSNKFHNFQHASHVAMSVTKLLSRIVAPKVASNSSSAEDQYLAIHDHTYGITSDPLTQFTCVFSALIHDAEHDGVPNAQLVKEETALATKYKNQSVAEQNSVDVAWTLLMKPQFKELRSTIYTDETEMAHFRKLLVNCVMATDICDKQLKDLRNKRWDRAFAPKQETLPEAEDDLEVVVNRKATIVIEHLLQASDVSHTMQHWHVFRNWNENLFMEMYFAFREGRAAKDPATFWYQGEIGFFDYYVIPLAKKLSQCGVFGVSSDEYLNYAESNRNEWEARGQEAVKELAAKAEAMYEEQRSGADKLAPEPMNNVLPSLAEETTGDTPQSDTSTSSLDSITMEIEV